MTDDQYEIRLAHDDELDRVHFIVAYSFTADRSEHGRKQMMHVEKMARPIILLDAGEPVAALRVYPFRIRIEGRPIEMGGVSSVSCLPEHRRKGHVGRLLIYALAEMRDKGQHLSALYTPHPDLYRRYGWMVAASNLKYTWSPKQVRPYHSERPAGHAERVDEEGWPLIAELYEKWAVDRTGPLERSEAWWREGFFRVIYDDGERTLNDVVVWRNEAGVATGYMSYTPQRQASFGSTVQVRELVTLSGEAQTGFLRYILSHDLSNEITYYGPIDDTFAYTVDNSFQLKREFVEDIMLRVVDVEGAVGARPAGPGAPEGALTIEISDAACPWNSGTWHITSEGGRLAAAKSDGAGQIAMEVATFAAVYDGYMKTTDAVRAGLAESTDAAAMALADSVFAVKYAPNCSDFF
jgi:predicted acetyltransferase